MVNSTKTLVKNSILFTIAPFLPKEWTGYKFRINFRGRLLSISVSQEGTQIDLLKGDDLTIKLNGKDLKLTAK